MHSLLPQSASDKSKIDYRLRNIHVRSQWGCMKTPDSVLRVADNEFIVEIGNRVVNLSTNIDKNLNSRYAYPVFTGVLNVYAIAISNDSKYIAISVKVENKRDVTMLVYEIKSNKRLYQGIPRQIHYDEVNPMGLMTHFSALSFSFDNNYIAAIPSPSIYGVIICDWQRDVILQTIPSRSAVTKVSFNPVDSSRICLLGSGGVFQFWRYTVKTIHAAPIVNIPRSSKITYKTCVWLSDDKILAGTECGRLMVVLNCQCLSILYPFHNGNESSVHSDHSVSPNLHSLNTSTLNTARRNINHPGNINNDKNFNNDKNDKNDEIAYNREYKGKNSLPIKQQKHINNNNNTNESGRITTSLTPTLSLGDMYLDEEDEEQLGDEFAFEESESSDDDVDGNNSEEKDEISHAIVSIIVHGDIVAVASEGGLITVYVIKLMDASGGHGASISLVLLAKYSLQTGVHTTTRYELFGIEWCLKSPSNYDILAVSSTSIQIFDIKSAIDAKNVAESMSAALAYSGIEHSKHGNILNTTTNNNNNNSNNNGQILTNTSHELKILPSKRIIMTFHCGKLHSLCLSTRMTLMATGGIDDETVRLVDYNNINGPGLLIEGYSEKTEELPSSIDLHPSGRFIAFGCEDSIREYAVTEGKFELMRRMPTKIAVTTSSGEPYMNNASVSLVKYSHGGHLLAVVTGRLVQIYQLYILDFNNGNDEKAGTYNRLMAMTDHSANITDLCFSEDDEKVYTTSVDGSVYEWIVSSSTISRQGDYIWKGACALKVVSHSYIKEEKIIDKTLNNSVNNNNNLNNNNTTTTNNNNIENITTIKKIKCSTILTIYEYDQLLARKEQKNKLKRQNSRSTRLGSTNNMRLSSKNIISTSNSSEVNSPMNTSTNLFQENAANIIRQTKSISIMSKSNHNLNSNNNLSKKIHNTPVFGILPKKDTELHNDINNNNISNVPSRVSSASKKKLDDHSNPSMLTYLAQWDNHISMNVKFIEIEAKVTTIAMGRIGNITDSLNIVLLGCSDGKVIISTFPFITLIINVNNINNTLNTTNLISSPNNINDNNNNNNDNNNNDDNGITPPISTQNSLVGKILSNTGSTGGPGSKSRTILDLNVCKILVNHSQRITHVAISQSGLWIFTCCEDGCIYMLSTSTKAGVLYLQDTQKHTTTNIISSNHIQIPSTPLHNENIITYIDNIPEYAAPENLLIMTDRIQLVTQNSRIDDLTMSIEDNKASNIRSMNQLTEKKDTIISELEITLKREIEKRDAIIINGREEHSRHAKALNEQITILNKENLQQTKSLEVNYEKKLAKEQLAYQELRQYLDEFSTHARLDIENAKLQVAERESHVIKSQNNALTDAEKQKATMLLYIDYIKDRYIEIIDAMEKAQEEERTKLKQDISLKSDMVETVITKGRTEALQLRRTISLMKSDVDKKDMQLLSMQTDLDWAKERINRLENALNSASNELKLKIETAERWEFKSGDQHQQIIELERIRKALTSQLHTLRQDLVPKEEKIVQISEQLQEMDREYEQSLTAVSEKELSLKQKSAKLHVLQKQVSQLRYTLSRKDGCLHRAAKLFEEYKHSMQKARFDSIKQPNNQNKNSTAARITEDLLRAQSIKNSASIEQNTNTVVVLNQDNNNDKNNNNKDILSVTAAAQIIGGPNNNNEQDTIMKRTKDNKEFVEVVVITDTMERSWKRMGDILQPYLKPPQGYEEVENSDVYQNELEAFEAEKQRQMLLMQRSIAGLKGNIELTNLVTANKVSGHLKDNKNLLFEVNSMRHELREYMMENQKLKAQIENMELRQKFKDEQLQREKIKIIKNNKKNIYLNDNNNLPDEINDLWTSPHRQDTYGLKHKDNTDLKDPHNIISLKDPNGIAGIYEYNTNSNSNSPTSIENKNKNKKHFFDSNMTSTIPSNIDSRRYSEISLEELELKPLTAPDINDITRLENTISPTPPIYNNDKFHSISNNNNNNSNNEILDDHSSTESLDGSMQLNSISDSKKDLVSSHGSQEHIQVKVSPLHNKPSLITSTYEDKLNKLDLIMSENTKEIKAKHLSNSSTAAEILNRYTNKFSASSIIENSNSALLSDNELKTNIISSIDINQQRKDATKKVMLNDVIKFPTINTTKSFETKINNPYAYLNKKNSVSTTSLNQNQNNNGKYIGWKRNNP